MPDSPGMDVSPFDAPVSPQRERIWDIVLVIAAGGAVGGAARHALNLAIVEREGGFPWSTFVENAVGSFLLGMVMFFLLQVAAPSRYARPFLGVGVLGGFTTFSAYTFDTRELLMSGQSALAGLYLFGSVAACLLAVAAGATAARAIAPGEPRRTR